MPRLQRIRTSSDIITWTVISDEGATVAPAEEYLEFARQRELAGNTVRA